VRSFEGSFSCACRDGFLPQRGIMKTFNPLNCEVDINECELGACEDISNATCVK
jgi:hypothetical protein